MVTEEDIYETLKVRGISVGIKHEAITDMIKKRRMNEKILIDGKPLPLRPVRMLV